MDLIKKNAVDVISHDATPLEVNTDARAFVRIGWLIVLAGVGGFLLWALLAPLDKGVPLSGTRAAAPCRNCWCAMATWSRQARCWCG
jgi:protease secretion system membrane fusion protein